MMRSVLAGCTLLALLPLVPAHTEPTPASSAAESRRAGAYRVAVQVDRAEVVLDEDVVRMTGRVRPRAAGQKVFLQHRRADALRWRTVSQASIKQSGRFVLKDRPGTPGVRSYRVVKPASDGIRWGRSRTVEVAVLAWEELVARPSFSSCGVLPGVTVQINGEAYPSSLLRQQVTGPCLNYVTYDLGGKCRSLRATYGMTDDSTAGSIGGVGLYDVRNQKSLANFPLRGGALFRDYVTDVTGAFQLTFSMFLSSPPEPPGSPAVGSPEVLCVP